jgi:hypothetical protein
MLLVILCVQVLSNIAHFIDCLKACANRALQKFNFTISSFRFARTYGIRKFKKGRRVGSRAIGGASKKKRRITSEMINFERRQVNFLLIRKKK